jgi:hypothetical protein
MKLKQSIVTQIHLKHPIQQYPCNIGVPITGLILEILTVIGGTIIPKKR